MADIPSQFTGMAGTGPAPKDGTFALKAHSYTPRQFEDTDVIVKVECCGLCGSDVHALDPADGKGSFWPLITGHEVIGEVVKAGPKSERKVGQRVGIGGQEGSCRQCAACKSDYENYCSKMRFTFSYPLDSEQQKFTQGGFADYVVTRGHFAIPIPDAIASEHAASLMCAGVTMFTPLKAYGVGKGTKVGIVGIGGLGHLGIQLAKALGAEVHAISSSGSKREDAKKLGADGYIDTSDRDAALKQYTGYFDLILCSSYQSGMPLKELYLPLVGINKRIVILGLPDEGYPHLGLFDLLGKNICGSLIGSPQDLKDMLALAAEHDVRPWVEKRPMKDINQALEDFQKGKPRYRYVLMN